jgi:alpha-galactosidase
MSETTTRRAVKASSAQHDIRIAYIGGGSRVWARALFKDLALCRKLTGRIALYDIDLSAARRNVGVAKEIFSHPQAQTSFKVSAVSSVDKALKGADFVVMSILPGPMQMFANDLDIPAKYGIFQAVGDTTGPGGISRALRCVPDYFAYGQQIMEHCPDAWVINYTNPMTLCTAALYAASPEIKAFGCCHEVFGTQARLAGLVEQYLGQRKPPRHEIEVDVSGVNHFTFVTEAHWQGVDLFPLIARHINKRGFFADRTADAVKQKEEGHWFRSQGLIAYDFFRRFGALGAAGDRHLAEFVPWYLTSEENLHRWGAILTPSSYRLGSWKEKDAAVAATIKATKAAKKSKKRAAAGLKLKRSGEEGLQMMLALLGDKPLDTNVNIPNRGQAPDLPLGAVVETNAAFRLDRVTPLVANPMPPLVTGLVNRVIDVQQATLEAAILRDRDQAFAALLSDPLVNIPTDKAWAMFNELLKANKAALKGWKI